MRPEVKIVNLETGEETVREMNDEEYANYQNDVAIYEAKIAAQAEAEVAKEAAVAKLAALGLDISDLKALGF
ncbi:hypothetical protein UFOVP540_6 [uncultured Caudovirales phage]|uniref:Uncharacterized protein n=1 Tax=uncultured Caudovirales phage TaxID=2100421 RepID=A0A6J5MRA7_9CAUD|nr:hypothetical protein UFOVP540_6 [uncultured Caudovirales phage]